MEKKKKIDSKILLQDAEGNWGYILGVLAPTLIPAIEKSGKHVPCPIHGGKDGFRLFKDWQTSGGGVSNQDGYFSNGISLLMWVNGWTFLETIHEVANVLGGNAGQGIATRKQPHTKPSEEAVLKEAKKNESQRTTLNRIWKETLHHADERALPMRHYLMNRGLFYYGLPETLRFHPNLPYFDTNEKGEIYILGRFPAMIGIVQNSEGQPVTLHRTFLDSSSGKKALVLEPKKLMPYPTDRSLTGSSIRLGSAQSTLNITEGIETALAVSQVIQQPVWSCISAGGLEKFHPPAEVDQVVVWADHDVSCRGIEAAENLRKYLYPLGISVEINTPDMRIPQQAKGIDWLDVLNLQGEEPIRKLHRKRIRLAA